MGIDWEFVGSLTEEQLKDSEDDDQIHQGLCEILCGTISDEDLGELANVKHLIRLAGLVIQQKTEDLQEVENYGTELVNEAEAKIVKLTNEIQAKESLISDLQHGGTGRDARYLRDELRTLETENERLKREVKELGSDASTFRDKIEKVTNDFMEYKANNRKLEGENDQLKKDILDLKNQMEAQREALMLKRDGDEGRMMKRLQSQENVKLISEIHELKEANEFLKDEVEEMTSKLSSATEELVKLTDEYAAMKSVINETDRTNSLLEEENAGLRNQVQDIQTALLEQGSADNTVMAHVNSEVEKWKELLGETEARLDEERRRSNLLTQQLEATKLDQDKKVMAELAQAVADKDKQIADLKQELDEGYKQMQLMGEFAEELQATEAVKETNHLEGLLKDYKSSAKADRERLRKLETESADRDRQLAEALTRIGQYENGTYGLREAVQEIKEVKKQLGIRDTEIAETTKLMNKLEMNLCNALDENEEMRRRLDLGPSENIDLSELRFTKAAKDEQLQALNRLLSTEVERLEAERVELKRLLRKQAMHRGVRAVELGLKTEDLEAIEEAASNTGLSANETSVIQDQMLEKLQQIKGEERSETAGLRKEMKELKIRNSNLSLANDDLTSKHKEVSARFGVSERERERFESALKEALRGKSGGKLEDQPEIYRLLSLLEDRLNQSYPDLTQHLKAQVSQLSGRNIELRTELTRSKEEVRRCERERAQAVADLSRFLPRGAVESAMPGAPMGGGAGGVMMAGGQGAALSHQLVVVMQEMEEKEEGCREMERQVLRAQDQVARLTAQQALLYREHHKLKSEKIEKPDVHVKHSDDGQVYKAELERLQGVLEKSGSEQKRALTDTSRRLVLLRVHERTLRRELQIAQERSAADQREIRRLQGLDDYRVKDARERISWLEQYKDTASFQLQSLREQLLACVPQKEVEALFDKYTSITAKYRTLLEEESLLQESAGRLDSARDELARCQLEGEEAAKQLALKTQRCARLEERLAALNEPTRDGETASLEDKLYNLEIQLVNEKQKASHAISKHSKLLTLTQELEERNMALETKFTALVEKNSDLQDREKTLSDELENVTKLGGKDSRTALLEKQVVSLQSELKRIQTMADISADQTRTLLARRAKRDTELEQYRVTLAEIEKQSDDKLTIGLLSQRLVEVQSREIEASKLAEEFKIRIAQEQGRVMGLECKLSDQQKLQELQHARVIAHVQLLSRTICYLRGQFSGAVPLARQQKLGEAVRALMAEKQELSLKLAQSESERGELEVQLEHSKPEKSLSSASKVRLPEMRLKRENTGLRQQIVYLERLVKDHEDTIRELEDENAGVYDLLTEQKALDKSMGVARSSAIVLGVATARGSADARSATGLEESVVEPRRGGYVVCSRCRDKLGAERDQPSKLVSLEVEYLSKKLTEKEDKIKLQKEEIDLLKNSLNSSHAKISRLNKDLDKLEEQLAVKNGSNPEDYTAFKKSQASAQQAMSVLNDRIDQKDAALKKYQGMLKEMRAEAKSFRDKHERELNSVTKEHNYKERDWLNKYQELSAELQSLQEIGAPPTPHKRAELEELVLEQDKSNAMLRDSMFRLRQEISDLKTERSEAAKNHQRDLDKSKAELSRKIKKQSSELSDQNKQNADLLTENKSLSDQLKQLQTPRSPKPAASTRLAEKEAEITKLKDALVKVRREMTSLIEERLRENATGKIVEEDGRKSAQRGEGERKRELEQLRSKVAKLQKEKDEAIREKAILEDKALNKLNPKQSAEIDTLQKQLIVQREKVAKLKAGTFAAPFSTRPSSAPSNDSRITELEKQLDAARQIQGVANPPSTAVDAWLDNKKWTKKVENQKKLLEKKDKEMDSLKKQNSSLRETIERLDREKLLLNSRLKNLQKASSKNSTKESGFNETQTHTQELRKKIFDLKEENARLTREVSRDITRPVAERDGTISVLKHTIGSLETQLQKAAATGGVLTDLTHLREASRVQEKRLVESEHEILSLKLRAEHAALELPRLRTRVVELQAYTDVLKPSSLAGPGKGVAAPKSTVGKSAMELERVINAMKRVIEKLQKENKQLKSQVEENCSREPGVGDKQPLSTDALEELQNRLKSSVSHAKALQEELDGRCDENASLKLEMAKFRTTLAEAQQEEEKKSGAVELEAKLSDNVSSLEQQLNTEQEVVQQLRSSLAKVEEDNKRKNGLLSEIRRRLTGVAEREADLEEEIRLLHQCKLPNGAKEIAREAVRLKRQNSALSAHLQEVGPEAAPRGVRREVAEKLEEWREEQEVMVRKIVWYQGQLRGLAERMPGEEVLTEYPGASG